MGCHDSFGAVNADVRAKTTTNQDYGDCPKTLALLGLFDNAGLDPVWRNYCLKGSQLAFADKGGRPKLLGNSLVDRINGRIPMAHFVLPDLSCARFLQQRGRTQRRFRRQRDRRSRPRASARLHDERLRLGHHGFEEVTQGDPAAVVGANI
jgi:hypothetical protein